VATEPAKNLLHTVRKKDGAQYDAHHQWGDIILSGQQLPEHEVSPFRRNFKTLCIFFYFTPTLRLLARRLSDYP
jgi:hypothetical protein